MSDNFSSDQYRHASQEEEVRSAGLYEHLTPSAEAFANEHNVPLDVAFNHVFRANGEDPEEVRWTRIPLNEADTAIGTEIKAKELSIACNSGLHTGMYNDTYVVAITEETATSVTYRQLTSSQNTHSGDIPTPYLERGLRHTTTFVDAGKDVKTRTFVTSASWMSGRRGPVTELIETKPILEIRVVTRNGEMKRYIVPQNFSDGGQNTACASAMITWDGENWTVKIIQEFINGFADDVATSISDLKNYLSRVSQPSVPSVACDDGVLSVAYEDDDVPSVAPCYDGVLSGPFDDDDVPSVAHDNFHPSDYVTEF